MPNMDPKKCPMPSQEPNVRNKNFKEVALGYTEEMAVNEAKRCLQCKNHPCRSGCPVEIDIPGFIKHVAEGDFEAAYNVIAQSSALPAVCGRVCPQEHQCEGKCVRGIKGEAVGIGRLERFVADWYRNNVHTKPTAPAPNGHKVAVIGAGPSGLTVAGDLAKLGYKVTVYEALHVAGGVLMYGIPEFRLPKDIVQHEVEGLKELGVDIEFYEHPGYYPTSPALNLLLKVQIPGGSAQLCITPRYERDYTVADLGHEDEDEVQKNFDSIEDAYVFFHTRHARRIQREPLPSADEHIGNFHTV